MRSSPRTRHSSGWSSCSVAGEGWRLLRFRRHHRQSLRPGCRAAVRSKPTAQHPVGQWRLACAAQAHSSVQAAASVLDAEVVIVPENDQGQLTGEAFDQRSSGRMTCSPWSRRRARRTQALLTTWPVSRRSASDSASGCTSTGRTGVRLSQPRVCVPLQRDRACRQLHRRPTQVAVRNLRLLRLALPSSQSCPAAHAHAGYLDAIDREVWNPWDYGCT